MQDDYAIPDILLRRFVDDLATRTILYREALECSGRPVEFKVACRRAIAYDTYFLKRWEVYRRA